MSNEEAGDRDDGDDGSEAEERGAMLNQLPDDRYTAAGAIDASTSREVCAAWLRMCYPLGSEGAPAKAQIHGEEATAIQCDDGAGYFQSRTESALFAFRTASGTIVGNAGKPAVWPDDLDPAAEAGIASEEVIEIPFGFVARLATDRTALNTSPSGTMLASGTTGTVTSADPTPLMRGIVEADTLENGDGVLLTHRTGVQFFVGKDTVPPSGDEEDYVGYVPFDGNSGTPVPSARDATDYLLPHRAAGHEQFVRQGKWFLTPLDGDDPEGSIQQPPDELESASGSPLESYLPEQWATTISDEAFVERARARFAGINTQTTSPQGVFDRLATIGAESQFYAEARALAGGICMRGSLRPREPDTPSVRVEGWHHVETLARDVAVAEQ